MFRGPTGSAGPGGPTLRAWRTGLPILQVSGSMLCYPADGKGLLKSAIRDDNPVLVMVQRPCMAIQALYPKEKTS